jgi:hypothetical protein
MSAASYNSTRDQAVEHRDEPVLSRSGVPTQRDAMRDLAIARPRVLLRLEGAAVFALAVAGYRASGGNWWLFALLLLAPDLAALGYLAGNRVGAATYNLVHTYALPLALLAYGLWGASPLALSLALIWLAHIGMDRTVGYGLKYATAFKDTHLGRV